MIKKTYDFKIEKVEKDDKVANFEGYASTYDLDLDNEIIARGAWTKMLKQNGETVPILVDHYASVMSQAGFNVSAKEDEKGLYIAGQLNLDTEAGATSYSLMKQAASLGVSMGLSVGFIPLDYEDDKKTGVRTFTETELKEYSIVVFQANPRASVTAVKELKDTKQIALKKREIEQALRDAGCSAGESKKAVSSLFEPLNELNEFLKLIKI